MTENKAKKKDAFTADFEDAEQMDTWSTSIEKQEEDLAVLDSLLNASCPTLDCDRFEREVTRLRTVFNDLRTQERNQFNKKESARRQIPLIPVRDSLGRVINRLWDRSTRQYRVYQSERAKYNKIKTDFDKTDSELKRAQQNLLDASDKYKAEQEGKKK